MSPEPSTDALEVLMVDTADAVCHVQEYLDWRALEGSAAAFSVPAVAVDSHFSIVLTSQSRWLIVFTRVKERRMRSHHVSFRLAATPTPPQAAIGGTSQFEIVAPSYLVAREDYSVLLDALIATLCDPSRRVTARFPSDDTPDMDLGKEICGLQELVGNDDDQHRGMVFLRLAGLRSATLCVRLDKEADKDSVFILHNGPPFMVDVFSYKGDDCDRILFDPLQQLIAAVRRATVVPLVVTDQVPGTLGLDSVRIFLAQLSSAWGAARSRLRDHATRVSMDPLVRSGRRLPSFYQLASVEAQLSYTVRKSGDRFEGFEFSEADTIGDPVVDDGFDLLSSRARMLLAETRDGDVSRVELFVPHFVMTPAVLDDFVRVIADNVNRATVVAAFAPSAISDVYDASLRDRGLARLVVVFLSYDEQNRPTHDFLVAWPAADGRDFVFTCTIDDTRVTKARAVVRLEHLAPASLLASAIGSDAGLDERAYKAFHNFFHSIRIWTIATAGLGT